MAVLNTSSVSLQQSCVYSTERFCTNNSSCLHLYRKPKCKVIRCGSSMYCSSSLPSDSSFWTLSTTPSLQSIASRISLAASGLKCYLKSRKLHLKTELDMDNGAILGSLKEQGSLAMALLSTTAMAKDHISPVLATLGANPTFMSGLVAWAVAQILKVFTTFFVERKWDWKMLVGSGGMPSSHSALCVALTTSVAVCHGISDALFPVCLGFSLIVMYDATGVRRHAGMQAEVLNLIVEDLFQGHPISQKKLKELLGHTPLQVGAGAIVGIIVGYLCSQGYVNFPGVV